MDGVLLGISTLINWAFRRHCVVQFVAVVRGILGGTDRGHTVGYGLVMTTRDRWLDEGLAVLAEHGVRGIRVDRIAARLGLTKGSFHHHFDGITDYHRSLLARFETDSMNAMHAAAQAVSHLAPEQALMQLPSNVSFDLRIEAAVRGWAFENEEAGVVLARVDTARLEMLIALWGRILPGRAGPRTAALVPHWLIIGASVALPRPTATDVQDVFSLLASLVPSVR